MGWPGRRTAALLPWLALLLLARQARGVVQKISAGAGHSCAVLEDESLRCWGQSTYGQLGYGDIETRGDEPNEMGNNLPPVHLGTGRKVVSVALGGYHSCATLDNGAMKCWGANEFGQLGQGDWLGRGGSPNEMGDNLPAIDLGTGRTPIAIAAGLEHTCALLDNHDIKCWGRNTEGQVGLIGFGNVGDSAGEMGDNLPAVDLGTNFTAIAIAAGDWHTCALSDAGQIKCWGSNDYGQLGQGDSADRGVDFDQMGDHLSPIDLGASGIAVAITAGDRHTCALLANGMIKCWGRNDSGQLGYGDTAARGVSPGQMGDNLPPVDLGANTTAVGVAAGGSFACAALYNGAMKCWGYSSNGELGQEDWQARGDDPNEMGDNLAPVNLGFGRTAKDLAVGGSHVMTLLDDGTLKAWGANFFGQLGLGHDEPVGTTVGTMGDKLPAVDLGGNLFPVCALGYFGQWTCDECPAGTWALAGAASTSECVQCRGGYSPLPGATRCAPCASGTASPVEGATSTEMAACELCPAGTYSPYPGATVCTDCAAGTYSNVTGATSQEVCELCPAATYAKNAAAECTQCPPGTYAAGSGWGSCFMCPRGTYSNHTGCIDCPAGLTSDLGSDSADDCYSSSDSLPSSGTMRVVAAGGRHSCAVLELGMLKCWGYNIDGQLGYGDTNSRGGAPEDMGTNLAFVDLGEGQSVAAVALGREHSCALFPSGAMKCWGVNFSGQLGQGETGARGDVSNEMGDYLPAIDLGTGRTAIAIAAGDSHSCALLDNHDIKCWGDNTNGQLGLGDRESRGNDPGEMGDNLPAVDLGINFTAIAIAAGDWHTCALSDAGQIKCWGSNSYGQLGQGDSADRGVDFDQMGDHLPPIDLGANGIAVAITAGDRHTCALLANGMIKCWGRNDSGQLGYGDTAGRGVSSGQMGDNLPPVDLGANTTAVGVAAGGWSTGAFTCALLDDGGVKCWGYNTDGQLGQEDTIVRGDDPNEMGDNLAPVNLGAGRTVKALAAGGFHVMTLLDDGTLKAWGSNSVGQLGLGHNKPVGTTVGTMGDKLPAVDLGGNLFPVCALGYFGQWTCDECPAGTWALAGAASTSECVQCRGGYSPLPGATQCIACAPGTVSSVQGATSTEMAACEPCGVGKYLPYPGATVCTDCAAGTYSNVTGATSQEMCELCPVGRFSAAVGASSEGTCEQCAAGRYADIPGSSACTDCAAGRYSDVLGGSTPDVCQECPPGRASSTIGADSESMCQQCVAGRYAWAEGTECAACVAGKYSTVLGATSNSTCTACPAGTWSSMEALSSPSECTACAAGRYSEATGATSESTCVPCEQGTYSTDTGADQCQTCAVGRFAAEAGKAECDDCPPGKYSSDIGSDFCDTCDAGTYSARTHCASCPAGKTSATGSEGVEECQSMTSSFAVGGMLMVVTIAVVLVYIVSGRAATVASKERQSALLPIIHACANISAHILATMKRQESGGVLQIAIVMLLTMALFVTTMLTFVTNTFLLSRSFFAPPEWAETFGEEITSLVQRIPPLGFLSIVPPVVKFIESIKFVDLLDGMEVTCSGAQAPLVLLINALIVIGTIVMIDAQLHTVMALALGPAIGLTRDKLISMPDTSFMMRAKNMLRFLILLVVSSFFLSFSRYTMQVFATLINYADFLPFHEWSRGCNSGDRIDELLATVSTMFFYMAAIPVMLLVVSVMMPGLPKRSGKSASEHCEDRHHKGPASEAPSTKRSVFQRVLDCINPFRWLLFGVDWLLKSLYGHAAMERPDKRQIASKDLMQHNAVEEAEVLGCTALLKSCCCCFWCCCCKDRTTPCQIVSTCAWKVKLSVYLAFGVWTDEIVQNLQVDEIAQQHFGWTADHTRSYEDVMAAAGPMRSMVWMLVPGTIVLTKLSEATNNPPVFVRSGFVKMASPVVFRSWAEAEAVMLEGRALLKSMSDDARSESTRPHAGCATAFEHNLLVMLVWIFGARLPQYLVNMTLILLAATAALQPAALVLMAAACILFPWSFLHALADALDVKTMLSLRKLAGSSDKSPRQQSIELPEVAVAVAEPLPAKGSVSRNADISAFYA